MITSRKVTGIILLLIAGIIGGVVGSGITLAVKDHHSSNTNTNQSTTSKTSATVYDPATIMKDVQAYVGKTVTMSGKLGKTSSAYYLTDTEKQPVAIKLDFSQSHINPDQYFTAPSKGGTPPAAKSLTFTGKLSQDKSGTPYLLVSSAN